MPWYVQGNAYKVSRELRLLKTPAHKVGRTSVVALTIIALIHVYELKSRFCLTKNTNSTVSIKNVDEYYFHLVKTRY